MHWFWGGRARVVGRGGRARVVGAGGGGRGIVEGSGGGGGRLLVAEECARIIALKCWNS